MKLFLNSQIRQIDQFTIDHEPINSIDLMERAADVLYEKYLSTFSYKRPVCIFAGPKNKVPPSSLNNGVPGAVMV